VIGDLIAPARDGPFPRADIGRTHPTSHHLTPYENVPRLRRLLGPIATVLVIAVIITAAAHLGGIFKPRDCVLII
jgi:hypothetical protein